MVDSGSDGDLLFITNSQSKNIPNEKRYTAKRWQTSSGIFKTTHMGNLELKFSAFSKSSFFSVRSDIVIVDDDTMFDLILGIETLANFGTILDFQDKTIHIDHANIAIRPLHSLGVKSNMHIKAFQTDDVYVPPGTCTGAATSFTRDHLEPMSTR